MAPYEKIYLYKRVVQAKLFIDQHFDEAIDVADIADEACFSKYHFIRLFKSIYGKTPHHYLTKVRIEQARLLLAKGRPVLDVSLSVGFDSPTSFSAAFKKLTGKAPSVFQDEHKARELVISSNPLFVIPNCFAQTQGWTE